MDTTKEYIRHLSLCSGYEGIGLGLRRVFPNVREVAHVEIEAFAIANLVAKMEENKVSPAPIWTDLKTFPYEKFLGRIDILSGGFPCQPFSHAGSREGVEDPRHLYPYISDGIGRCRPRLVFLENVEGIISSKTEAGQSVLLYVLQDLESMGYIAEAGVFSASEVGAPHQRKRVFIMGYAIKPSELVNSESECNGLNKTKWKGRDTTSTSSKLFMADSEYIRFRGRITSGSSGMDSERSETSQEGQTQCDIRSEVERCGGKLQTKEVADSSIKGSQGNKLNRTHYGEDSEQKGPHGSVTKCSTQRWPSRPGELQHEWEEPRTTPKPQLGGATNGASSRVDRLRLLGNGVVPQTVEVAFRTLIKRIEERIKLI